MQPAAAIGGVPDPRPVVTASGDGARVVGARCERCGYPVAEALTRCPVCLGPSGPAEFGPGGSVFAATVLRVPVPGRRPPYGLAYVDVDDGPRILAHVEGTDAALVPGARVRLVGTNDDGDPTVAPDDHADPDTRPEGGRS